MNEEDNKRLGRLIFALACGNISVLDEIYQMLPNCSMLWGIFTTHSVPI